MDRFGFGAKLTLDEIDGGFKEVQHLLTPNNAIKLTTLEKALSCLGKRAEIHIF